MLITSAFRIYERGDGTHYFSGGNQQGTFSMEGEFPSPGLVTGHIIEERCGVDLDFEATEGAEPPPRPPCTPEPDPLGNYCADPGPGFTPPPPGSTDPPNEDESAACERATEKVKKIKEKLKDAGSPDEKAKLKEKLKKAKQKKKEACGRTALIPAG